MDKSAEMNKCSYSKVLITQPRHKGLNAHVPHSVCVCVHRYKNYVTGIGNGAARPQLLVRKYMPHESRF